MSSNLEEGLTKINELLCEDIPDDRFATAFLGVVEAGQNRINALSAGHEPVYSYRAATRTVEKFPVGGLPPGVLKSCIYKV